MPTYTKTDFPTGNVRRFLEPGPIVLVSSAHKRKTNIMTMGWHMIMEFQPSLVGAYIWTANRSFEMIRRSRQCVINLPTEDLAAKVVRIGNSSGRDIDKFSEFGLTAKPASHVRAPLIEECYANFECRLVDSSLIRKYSLFVLEVVKAHVATSPKYPKTIHYRGDGEFMISGATPAAIAGCSRWGCCEGVRVGLRLAPLGSLAPRLRGEGWGEGFFQRARTDESPPHPALRDSRSFASAFFFQKRSPTATYALPAGGERLEELPPRRAPE
jgi:flavin reductase (DIM6/NTAB) family NADH-FMN oxidoreductase RutF